MKFRFAALLATPLSALLAAAALSASAAELAARATLPDEAESMYTEDGKLQLPENYREWIFLSSGLDMNYSDQAGMQGHSMFDNVFVDPASYRAFVKTGTWPDKTLLVMELRGATDKGSINRHGKFQTDALMGVEVHVKDTRRFPGGWAFFNFSGVKPAAPIPTSANCYSCHEQHGAVDTTFVQFYPTLMGIAAQKGTLLER